MQDKEIIEVNGIKYEYLAFYERLQATEGQVTKREIMCPKCHSTEFTISYGNYECVANCKCGHSMTVYDG